MPCNSLCGIYTICQRKFNPPEICLKCNTAKPLRNGYSRLAMQEQLLRMDAIENRGDFG